MAQSAESKEVVKDCLDQAAAIYGKLHIDVGTSHLQVLPAEDTLFLNGWFDQIRHAFKLIELCKLGLGKGGSKDEEDDGVGGGGNGEVMDGAEGETGMDGQELGTAGDAMKEGSEGDTDAATGERMTRTGMLLRSLPLRKKGSWAR